MQNTENNQNVRLAISLVVGIVIGFALHWLLVASHPSTGALSMTGGDMTTTGNEATSTLTQTGAASGMTTPSPMMTSGDGSNSISVSNQAPSSSVLISSVTLSAPSWVSIEELSGSGNPVDILGAAYVSAGAHANISVPLLAPTVSGQTYYAVIRSSNQPVTGPHMFNAAADQPLKDASGNLIMMRFVAGNNNTSSNPSSGSGTTASSSDSSVLNL